MKQNPKQFWDVRHKPHHFGQRTWLDFILWSIVVIVALGIGIYSGHKVTSGYKDVEIMDAQKALAEANAELAFWKTTMNGLAEGDQFEGVDIKGRPSTGD